MPGVKLLPSVRCAGPGVLGSVRLDETDGEAMMVDVAASKVLERHQSSQERRPFPCRSAVVGLPRKGEVSGVRRNVLHLAAPAGVPSAALAAHVPEIPQPCPRRLPDGHALVTAGSGTCRRRHGNAVERPLQIGIPSIKCHVSYPLITRHDIDARLSRAQSGPRAPDDVPRPGRRPLNQQTFGRQEVREGETICTGVRRFHFIPSGAIATYAPA